VTGAGASQWLPAPARPAPGTQEAHVWRIWLDSAPVQDAVSLLDERERAVASERRHDRERARYVASHAALRDILGRYVGVSAAAIRFDRSPRGHPTVAAPGAARSLRFSLSRSSAMALVAVTRICSVGVDLECLDDRAMDVDEVSQVFLPASERAMLARLEQPARADAFLRLWTRREASLKARGLGLPDGVGDDGRFVAVDDGLTVRELPPGSGYVAALAVDVTHAVRLISWSPAD
jgi:4'-phosphopantetheinyl transferase